MSGWWLHSWSLTNSSHIILISMYISNINPKSQVIGGQEEVPTASAISWRQFNPKCRTAVAEGKPFR